MDWTRKPNFYLAVLLGVPLLVGLGYWLGPQQLQPLQKTTQIQSSDYSQISKELHSYLSTRKGRYAVYYQDLSSGKTWGINENLPLPPASCIKVPVILYLNQQVASGKLHWNDRVTFHQQDFQAGAGALQYTAREGDSFSLRCLATISITISDNTAYNMLVRFLGQKQLLSFMRAKGMVTERPYGSAPTTARGLGRIMEGVARLTAENPQLGGRLLDDLSHTIFHIGLPGLLPPALQVAHKEGSIEGVVTDIGIICSKRPYILVILSDGIPEEFYGFATISQISKLIYDHQQQLPPATVPGLPR